MAGVVEGEGEGEVEVEVEAVVAVEEAAEDLVVVDDLKVMATKLLVVTASSIRTLNLAFISLTYPFFYFIR